MGSGQSKSQKRQRSSEFQQRVGNLHHQQLQRHSQRSQQQQHQQNNNIPPRLNSLLQTYTQRFKLEDKNFTLLIFFLDKLVF